jgi:hypothetical protein
MLKRCALLGFDVKQENIRVTGTDKPTALRPVVQLCDYTGKRLYIRLASSCLALRRDILVDDRIHKLPTTGRKNPLAKRSRIREQNQLCLAAVDINAMNRGAVIFTG